MVALRLPFVLAAFVLLLGCSNSDGLPTYPLSGTVRFENGQVVEEGTILFVAAGLPAGRGSITNGEYKVGTYRADDGIVAGTFQVGIIVSPPADYDPDAKGKPPMMAKAKYARPDTSDLEFEVRPEGERRFNIELERGR